MVERKRTASMTPGASPELTLLKAFEAAMREGLLLDEAIGGILGASLRLFDAAAVGLLPAGGAPPMLRSAAEASSSVNRRMTEHLESVLAKGAPGKTVEEDLAIFATPVKVLEQVSGAFGVAFGDPQSMKPEAEEAVRVLARIVSHVLERERTFAKLIKRREEAVALFELASGALHSLSADEVIRMTVVSLARELDFDRVIAFRFHAETREIEEILSQGTAKTASAPSGRRPIDAEPILVRCLSAHGPAFEDAEGPSPGQPLRKRLALPIQTGDTVFGFLTMTRRGAFVLTPQEMRLAQELAKLAAGALEKARLIEAERRSTERIEFVSRLHAALGGLTEVSAVLQRTVEEVGPHLDLDLCAVRLSPSAELPGAAAAYAKSGAAALGAGDDIPDALLAHLSAEGAHVLLADVSAEGHGLSLIPAPSVVKSLPRPISLLAVPLAYRGAIVGVLAGVVGGRPKAFSIATRRAFEAIAVELSLAVTSTRLIQKERDSNRFLDRLREVGRTLTTTFDAARIKQVLCEQAVALLKADAAQFWDADEKTAHLTVTSRWGAEIGGDLGRTVAIEQTSHPAVRAYFERAIVLVGEDGMPELYGGPATGPPVVQAAVLAIVYQDELLGLLSIARRRGAEAWPPDLGRRLALLADSGAVSLHNARMMKIIERDSERDGLTGLYTRAALLRRLETEIRRAERSGQPIAVAHTRVDGFQEAVQKLGSDVGDGLLPKISAQLVRATRAVNMIGRDRGDRFFVLVFDANKAQAHRAAESIQKGFVSPGSIDPRLDQAGIKLTLTIGIAAYPEDAFDTPSLVLRAEEALDEAVKLGAGKVVLYGAFFGADESELTM
ncbi:MAG TPA: diguanylate cyclase [Thermoanaerobaculia bacterium]|nr:diguanylate cyclase [Thermoanaerobaculia bacterium]